MNSGSTGEKLLSPPLDPSPFSVTFGALWCFLFFELLSESQRIENRCTHFGVLWCCYLTQNFAVFWCILVLLYAYLNLERMKSDTCFDVFRCILKSILILMQLYEPRDSPFCSIEVSELFTGNRSLSNTAQTEQTSIAAGKPLMTPVLVVRIKL